MLDENINSNDNNNTNIINSEGNKNDNQIRDSNIRNFSVANIEGPIEDNYNIISDNNIKNTNTNNIFNRVKDSNIKNNNIITHHKNSSTFFNEINNNEIKNNININEDNNTPYEMSYSTKKRIFVLFLLANGFLNYDTGVLPASLLEIEKEISLTYKEQALVGSLVYLGLSFASIFVSALFNKYGPAKVCSFMIALNAICCFIFSVSVLKPILFTCRFFMGVTEAFVVIYGPVWVNNYAPDDSSTKWMGILHTFSAIGVIWGYIVAGIIINFFNMSWRYAIQVQGIAEIPICLLFYFENEKNININLNERLNINDSTININNTNTIEKLNYNNNKPIHMQKFSHDLNFDNNIKHKVSISKETTKQHAKDKSLSSNVNPHINIKNDSNINNNLHHNSNLANTPKYYNHNNMSISTSKRVSRIRRADTRIDTVQTSNFKLYLIQAKEVLTNMLYIWVCLGLCSMYFIVTGVQFWITSYLIDYLGNDPVQVIFIFSFISITAPMSGVLIGSSFADKYGGYKGKNVKKALKLCSAFGLVAFIFSFPLGFLYSIVYISVLLWAFLFFGAAIVPVGTGIMISSVNKNAQATSSSISQLIFNFLGYFMSPILTGIIMDSFTNKNEGYKWGMRVIFWWSIFAAIFMSFALIVAINRDKKLKENKDDISLIDDELGQNMGDIIKLEIMRRMAQNV